MYEHRAFSRAGSQQEAPPRQVDHFLEGDPHAGLGDRGDQAGGVNLQVITNVQSCWTSFDWELSPLSSCSSPLPHSRISYCSADATYDRVFAFIATNRNETLECHAFLCPKRKMVSVTPARAGARTHTLASEGNMSDFTMTKHILQCCLLHKRSSLPAKIRPFTITTRKRRQSSSSA